MQFEGGYRYPSISVCLVLSFVVLAVGTSVWVIKWLSYQKGIGLILSLEGVVLLASAFTPKGLVPPPAGFVARIRWFFKEQSGVPLSFNQPLFYAGIIFLLVATVISVFAS